MLTVHVPETKAEDSFLNVRIYL